MSTTTKNGAPRKQLSHQLDRLDGVIDALDENLQATVAQAVRQAAAEAVGEAVQAVLVELMTNPELRRMVQPPPEQPPPPKDYKPKGGTSLLSRAWGRVCATARSCAAGVTTACKAVRLAWHVAGSRVRSALLLAAGAAAAVAYAARERIVGAASAAVGMIRALISSAGRSLGRLAPAFAS